MLRKFLLPLLLVVPLFLLAGCYNVDAKSTIGKDDVVTYTVKVGFPKGAATQGAKYKKALQELKKQFPKGTKFTPFDEGAVQGVTAEGSAPAAQAFPKKDFIYTHTGDEYVLARQATGDAITADALKAMFPGVSSEPSWTLTFTFPQPVVSASNGLTIDGNSVTVPSAVALSGEAWQVKASPQAKVQKSESPESAVPQTFEEGRNPLPGYIFMGLIAIGLALFVFGRYYDWSKPKNRDDAAAAPAKAKKPKKVKKPKK